MVDPVDFFNETNFYKYFNEKLKHKKGGGIDNLTASTFYKLYRDKFKEMAQACMDGTYKFSCYCEKLVVKQRNKHPRVLSIPAMKDRLVLGVTNQYLQTVYKEKSCRQPMVNEIIASIRLYLRCVEGNVRFVKTDFSHYYDTIRRDVLLGKMKSDIHKPILELIAKAISTPTIPKGMKSKKAISKKHGIPQGLSISNILAFVYLQDFDINYAESKAGLYKRYVDDMLFLNPSTPNVLNEVKHCLSTLQLHVKFSNNKVKSGILGHDELTFLGYNITKEHILIPQDNVSRFITRIAGLVRKLNSYDDKKYRPRFLESDDKYIKYAIELLNIKLSGFRSNGELYGWVPYYQSITDISVLYGIDRILKNKIMRNLKQEIKNKLNSLVDTYYDIKEEAGSKLVRNFDKIETIKEKCEYLKGMGYDLEKADDDEVSIKFERFKSYLIRDNERNIGVIS